MDVYLISNLKKFKRIKPRSGLYGLYKKVFLCDFLVFFFGRFIAYNLLYCLSPLSAHLPYSTLYSCLWDMEAENLLPAETAGKGGPVLPLRSLNSACMPHSLGSTATICRLWREGRAAWL
jgi:hypothetical protein